MRSTHILQTSANISKSPILTFILIVSKRRKQLVDKIFIFMHYNKLNNLKQFHLIVEFFNISVEGTCIFILVDLNEIFFAWFDYHFNIVSIHTFNMAIIQFKLNFFMQSILLRFVNVKNCKSICMVQIITNYVHFLSFVRLIHLDWTLSHHLLKILPKVFVFERANDSIPNFVRNFSRLNRNENFFSWFYENSWSHSTERFHYLNVLRTQKLYCAMHVDVISLVFKNHISISSSIIEQCKSNVWLSILIKAFPLMIMLIWMRQKKISYKILRNLFFF